MLPGETLCKLVQIFPPKVLVYIRKKFLDTLLIENTLLERILKQINALLNVTY